MKLSHLQMTVVVLAILAPGVAFGQIKKCPTIWVDGPTSEGPPGPPMVFTARLSGLNATARPEFRWEVSAGTVVSGQGTQRVTIDTAGLGGVTVTAKVTVTGITTACPTEASRSTNIYPEGVACGLPFDNYGEIQFKDEKARLDNFAIQLSNLETATGYIFVYAGRRSYEGEAVEKLLRAKEYLVQVREIDPARIITIDGGYKEDFEVNLIIAPQGATPPVPLPTVSPGEIELTKTRLKSPTRKSGGK